MEKSFCHDLQHRIMIHPYDTVQPTRMGMVEIPVELAKAICLHRNYKQGGVMWKKN